MDNLPSIGNNGSQNSRTVPSVAELTKKHRKEIKQVEEGAKIYKPDTLHPDKFKLDAYYLAGGRFQRQVPAPEISPQGDQYSPRGSQHSEVVPEVKSNSPPIRGHLDHPDIDYSSRGSVAARRLIFGEKLKAKAGQIPELKEARLSVSDNDQSIETFQMHVQQPEIHTSKIIRPPKPPNRLLPPNPKLQQQVSDPRPLVVSVSDADFNSDCFDRGHVEVKTDVNERHLELIPDPSGFKREIEPVAPKTPPRSPSPIPSRSPSPKTPSDSKLPTPLSTPVQWPYSLVTPDDPPGFDPNVSRFDSDSEGVIEPGPPIQTDQTQLITKVQPLLQIIKQMVSFAALDCKLQILSENITRHLTGKAKYSLMNHFFENRLMPKIEVTEDYQRLVGSIEKNDTRAYCRDLLDMEMQGFLGIIEADELRMIEQNRIAKEANERPEVGSFLEDAKNGNESNINTSNSGVIGDSTNQMRVFWNTVNEIIFGIGADGHSIISSKNPDGTPRGRYQLFRYLLGQRKHTINEMDDTQKAVWDGEFTKGYEEVMDKIEAREQDRQQTQERVDIVFGGQNVTNQVGLLPNCELEIVREFWKDIEGVDRVLGKLRIWYFNLPDELSQRKNHALDDCIYVLQYGAGNANQPFENRDEDWAEYERRRLAELEIAENLRQRGWFKVEIVPDEEAVMPSTPPRSGHSRGMVQNTPLKSPLQPLGTSFNLPEQPISGR